MHLQSITDTASLMVHHSLGCCINGGYKSKHYVMENLLSQTIMGTIGVE
jgi:hypothetical protein